MRTEKLLPLFALALAIALPGAAAAQDDRSRFFGFYVGGQGAYSYIDVDASATGVGSANEDMDGFGGGGYAGFGGTNGPVYGAIEVELGYDNADWTEGLGGGVTAEAETELTYGVSFLLGGVFEDRYLVYGRAGWQRTHAEASVTGFGSESEDFDGIRVGGGFQAFITDNISARAEYTYTWYEDAIDIPGVDFDIAQQLFRVGVAYHF